MSWPVRRRVEATLLVSSLALAGACEASDGTAGEIESDCRGGKCDAVEEPTACAAQLRDRSGAGLQGDFLADLDDPAAHALFGETSVCPTTYREVLAAMDESEACSSFLDTMVVSEHASLTGERALYRTVSKGFCAGSDVLLALIDVDGRGDEAVVPDNVEIITVHPERGVFNYYEARGESVSYFGSSEDFIVQGPGAGEVRKCANCHTGGGLIMKELAPPWQRWESVDRELPGAQALMFDLDREDLLGNLVGAEDLEENIVEPMNEAWNERRIDRLVAGLGTDTNVAALLRPLFCTVEVNIETAFGEPGALAAAGVLHDAEAEPGFFALSYGALVYEAIIDSFGQRTAIPGVIDTVETETIVVRGEADIDYQRRLAARQIVDQEFVDDVRMVDFTRPIFSEDRCGLLRAAPELTAETLTPKAIRDGFIANLQGAPDGTVEADFREYLADEDDDLAATVGRMLDACADRLATEDDVDIETSDGSVAVGLPLHLDLWRYVFHVRRIAQALPVFEFDGLTMPEHDLETPSGLRFDPLTCQLTTKYTPLAAASG